jgi:5-oxoprolinase (ATP-hydrolysing) subunit A
VTTDTTRYLDLNADLGEHDGDRYAVDFAMLDMVSSANIACGAHAGSAVVMRATVSAAYERGVSIGAHPGYPDRDGFGRREPDLGTGAIVASFEAQIELLMECCAVEGARMRYVKPHGALYNRAARDDEIASLLAACVARFDPSLVMLTLAGSALDKASRSHGLIVAREAFIDRAYLGDGRLVPRTTAGAVIDDPIIAAARAVDMACYGTVHSMDGERIRIEAESLCVHGDSQNALETLRLTREALGLAGFEIRAFAQ